MRTKPSLQQIRDAITRRKVVAFQWRGMDVKAEPRLLGLGGRYRTYLLLAWQLEADEGWQLFRFSEIYEFCVLPEMVQIHRPACGRLKREIHEFDTWGTPVQE
ncbi:hypothetical protein [Luteolibacter luteus]|uniref:WYL domain-containing protein n=1 Tax=Luteolibacter luteus TaxID=2728835 RepID=A0A858RIU2_9BACT|nr:hypothetical protein [Luteolibacter luteus]QJE95973.1 hypothetical protein HHL09_09325 [Luteolibacter luteus]